MAFDGSIRRRWRILKAVLRNAWPVWLFVSGVVVSWQVGLRGEASAEDQIRVFGLALQSLGILVVAYGLSRIRQVFGNPSVLQRARAWFRQLWSVIVLPELQAVTAMAGGTVRVVGSATAILGVAPGASPEERIARLEKAIVELREHTNEDVRKLRVDLSSTAEGLRKSLNDHQKKLAETEEQLSKLAVGDFTLQLVGILWLLVGTFFSTLPIH